MIALVTGGAQGIGRAMVEECALRGYDVIVASLPDAVFDKTITELNEKFPSRKFFKYEVNFLQEDAVDKLHAWTKENNLTIDALVNNVGLGSVGPFEEAKLSFHETMIKLNTFVVTKMCYAFLPDLKQSKAPILLNVSSFAGTVPVPNKAVYSSTKGFVLNLTLSLRQELKKYNIKVSALCPGAVITSPEVQKRIEEAGYFSKKSAIYPDKLAEIAFKQTIKGKAVIIPGFLNLIFRFLLNVLPLDTRNHLMAKAFK